MKKKRYQCVFFRLGFFMILLPLLSFISVSYSKASNGVIPAESLDIQDINSDTAFCGSQPSDTLLRFARFDHADSDAGYYYVKLYLLHSKFQRLDFYEKARRRNIFMVDKGEFHSDSTLFSTTLDSAEVPGQFAELYQSSAEANSSTSETTKNSIVGSSSFYKAPAGSNSSMKGAFDCSTASVACSENSYQFPADTVGNAPPPVLGYPNYGCLNSTPCPAWYFMKVAQAGDIIINISQTDNHDVDFICWGPFTSLTNGCNFGLTGSCPKPSNPCCNNNTPGCLYPKGNIVDCSYSTLNTETCHILNAQVGEFYILLMTNYSEDPGFITFSQTGGLGATSCDIVDFCSMLAITATGTTCNPLNNTFSVSGNIEFSNPSPTGTLTITDNTAIPPIVETFNPPFTSPLAYNLTGIPCDGVTHSITAVFTDSLNCNLTQQITSPAALCPNSQISGGGPICDDGTSITTVSILISGSPGPYTFTYAIDGIDQTPVVDYNGAMPYQFITSTAGLYTLTSVTNQVCTTGGIITGSAEVILNPLPVPSFSEGDHAPCLNSPDKVYTTETGKSDYIWTIPAEATVTAGGGTSENSVTLTWNTAGNYSIGVKYTDPTTTCTAATETIFSVEVNTLPEPSFTAGESSVCLNIPDKVYETEAGMSNYIWTIPPEATITTGGGTSDNSLTLTWNTAGNYSVGVKYTDPATTCTAASATNFSVEVKPLPAPSFTAGENSVCLNIPGKVYATEAGKTNYIWTIPPEATKTAGGNTDDNTVTLTWKTAGVFSIGVNYTDPTTTCTAATASTFSVEVKPLPAPTFTAGENTVCLNIPNKVYETEAGMSNYIWTVPPEAIKTAGGSAADNSVTLTWKTAGVFLIGVNYSDPNTTCTAATATTFSVEVKTLPTPSFTTGENAVCLNILDNIYATEAGKLNYIWTIPPEAIKTAGGTADDNSVTLTWNKVGNYFVGVNYTDPATTCTAASATTYPVNVKPLPSPSFIAGENAVCLNVSGQVYTTEAGKSDYIWLLPPQATKTAGGGLTDNSVAVTWNTVGNYSISANYTDPGTMCSAATATPFTVTVNPLPVTTITPGTGPECELQHHVYETPSDPACTFTWSPPGCVVSGQGTNSATLNWPVSGPATVSVTGTYLTTTGCKSSSAYSTTVNPTPVPSFIPCFDLNTTSHSQKITLRGGTPFLPDQGIYTGNRVNYNPLSGNFEFDPAGAPSGPYQITYKYTNIFNCTASSAAVTINVFNSSLNCGDSLTDVRDGKKYKTSLIGGRCWMQQNLNYGTPLVLSSQAQTDNCISEKFCLPTDPTCKAYGGFYQWDELMAYSYTSTGRGLCPPEWHVPSEAEWQWLIDAISTGITPPADGVAGSFIKDTLVDQGFGAQTRGMGYMNKTWAFTTGQEAGTMFWTATPSGSVRSIARGVNSITPSTSRFPGSRANAFSVRCIKD
ncbi:MAG: hypothetical protein NTW16_08370 [Bacteroidetes bacterium]|nr:hypothetical protein [Bacteroidota bacterium]